MLRGETHRALFKKNPSLLAGDKGFYEDMKQIAALEKDIKTVSICKKGKLTEEQHALEEAYLKLIHEEEGK